MYLLYVDEFGHDGIWDPNDPRYRHHPLFGLAGAVIPGERARDFDRGYLALKREIYKNDLAIALALRGIRPERYEVKQLSGRRDREFARRTLNLVKTLGGNVMAYGQKKPVGYWQHRSDSLYGATVQGLLRAFEKCMRNKAGKKLGIGMVVMDRRDEVRNHRVLASAQSHLFAAGPGVFDRIVETPLLVPSEWYHGVQAADTIGRIVGGVYRHRLCQDPKSEVIDRVLGPSLDDLTYKVGGWRSVYIRA